MGFPFVVVGTVTDSGSSNVSTKVVMRNNRTGEKINQTSNSSGQYVLDAANLASGYMDTDTLSLIAAYGDEDDEESILISTYGGGTTVNLILETVADSADTTYCQIQDVLDELGDKSVSDISYERVRKIILRNEADIDERSETKFKSTTITEEIHNFDQYTSYKSAEQLRGHSSNLVTTPRADNWNTIYNDKFKLNHSPVLAITSLYKNLAGASQTDNWDELTEQEGSAGDFLVNKDIGVITFVNNVPPLGQRRIKVTYTYGYSVVPKVVEDLCVLLSVKKIIISKASDSQFESIDAISLEGYSDSKGISGTTGYITLLNEEIEKLWEQVGDLTTKIS